MQKFLYFLFFTLISQGALSANFYCPSIEEIKKNMFVYWVPLYQDGEELASEKDIEQFKQAVDHFEVARWNRDYLESAHCFYSGNDIVVNKIVFARDAWRPINSPHWEWLKLNAFAECKSTDVISCGFIE